MRHFLLMIAVVACSLCLPAVAADKKPLITDPIVEKWIRTHIIKPKGELTKADLEKVGVFSLRDTQLTNKGLKEVVKLKNLTELYLKDTQLTDAGLKEAAKLQRLRRLKLTKTTITDAGLKEVAKLKTLRVLLLADTKVTKAGMAELQKALPKCKIYHNATK